MIWQRDSRPLDSSWTYSFILHRNIDFTNCSWWYGNVILVHLTLHECYLQLVSYSRLFKLTADRYQLLMMIWQRDSRPLDSSWTYSFILYRNIDVTNCSWWYGNVILVHLTLHELTALSYIVTLMLPIAHDDMATWFSSTWLFMNLQLYLIS